MRRAIRMFVLAAVVAAVPASAHAETYFNPWLGVFFGNDNQTIASDKSFTSFGAMVGDTGSKTGFELTFGYTPDFFGKGLDSNELDLMVGLTAGPMIGRGTNTLRPYGAGGVGLLRTSILGRLVKRLRLQRWRRPVRVVQHASRRAWRCPLLPHHQSRHAGRLQLHAPPHRLVAAVTRTRRLRRQLEPSSRRTDRPDRPLSSLARSSKRQR